MRRVLIACVGNILRGDDGFGVVVAEHLVAETLLDRSRRHPADDGVGRHIAGDPGARRQHRPIPHPDSRQHDDRMADPDVMPDDDAIGPP